MILLVSMSQSTHIGAAALTFNEIWNLHGRSSSRSLFSIASVSFQSKEILPKQRKHLPGFVHSLV